MKPKQPVRTEKQILGKTVLHHINERGMHVYDFKAGRTTHRSEGKTENGARLGIMKAITRSLKKT